MKKIFIPALFILFTVGQISAQSDQRLKNLSSEYTLNGDKQVNFVKLKEGYTVNESSIEDFLNNSVLASEQVTVKKVRTETDQIGYTHSRYQLHYNNTPVNNAIIIVHSKDGKVVSINGDLVATQKPVNSVSINESKGLEMALKKVNAKKYKWENTVEEQHMREVFKPDFTFYPKGDLILYTTRNKAQYARVHYAYKYNIYAEVPLYRANVIVDAQTGAILAEENQICTADVPSTANTKYSGTQPFTTDNFSAGNYRLRETGRGNGIETYNLNNTTTYANTDFTYTNTVWPTTAPIQTGTDAHWGAEMTYDYYNIKHSRNSIDNAGYKLLSYVHYSNNYNNAFWDGTRMTYGDGNGTTFTILTALDVCGHEITHGLTNFTAALNGGGAGEADALNEGFSDIFGTTIENFARPGNWDWKIGADITPSGNGLRNMSNPNLLGQPDTYLGTNWDPMGEPHNNNGPCIFWYYLLCQGGTGTNDISNSYTVTGLGMNTAANIAYRALTVYFTPSTGYLAARNYAIQAAKDLYGNCSNEVVQTTNAWYAVGVGPAYSNVIGPNFNASNTSYCTLPANVNFNNTTANGLSYTWDFGDGATSTSTNPAHTYTASGNYTVKLVANGCLSSVDSLSKPTYINISIPGNPLTTGGLRCGSGTVNLSASGGSNLLWYSIPSATGTPINTGGAYTTPVISGNTTYYVVNSVSNTPVFGAPTNSTIGGGGNYNTATAYDIFDVLQPCTLKSAVVYASTTGNRTFELRNSANTIITSTVINLAVGANTVNLNFAIPAGTNYRLGLNSASAVNLYRNNSGAVYPYNISGIINITGSSAGTPGYFYFYYNWQVQKDNCTSPAIAVTASVNSVPALSVNSSTICNGQTATLTASGATTYSWNTGASTSGINVNPTTNTTYTAYGFNGPCSGSAISNVVVNPLPTVSASPATNVACVSDGLISLTGTPAGGTFSGAGVSGTNFDPTTGVGTYNIVYSYTDANGCSDVNNFSINVSICTDVQLLGKNAQLSLYPNPANEYFMVSSGMNMTVKMMDASGRLVLEKDLTLSTERIDISKLANGIYFVELSSQGKRIYKTNIIKQ